MNIGVIVFLPMLTEKQVDQLKLAHKQTREKRLADRIKAVLYVHFGLSYTEIAKLLLFDEITVRRYIKSFKESSLILFFLKTEATL